MIDEFRRYRVILLPEARQGFDALPEDIQRQIRAIIDDLEEDPLPLDAKAMWGKAHGHYRIRLGDYRIVYRIVDNRLIVLVIRLGPRDTVYEGLESMVGDLVERGLTNEDDRRGRDTK